MKEDIKQFYEKLDELEMELFKERNFLNKHNYRIEALCLTDKIDMIRRIKIQYSLFFDGNLTIDQIDLKEK